MAVERRTEAAGATSGASHKKLQTDVLQALRRLESTGTFKMGERQLNSVVSQVKPDQIPCLMNLLFIRMIDCFRPSLSSGNVGLAVRTALVKCIKSLAYPTKSQSTSLASLPDTSAFHKTSMVALLPYLPLIILTFMKSPARDFDRTVRQAVAETLTTLVKQCFTASLEESSDHSDDFSVFHRNVHGTPTRTADRRPQSRHGTRPRKLGRQSDLSGMTTHARTLTEMVTRLDREPKTTAVHLKKNMAATSALDVGQKTPHADRPSQTAVSTCLHRFRPIWRPILWYLFPANGSLTDFERLLKMRSAVICLTAVLEGLPTAMMSQLPLPVVTVALPAEDVSPKDSASLESATQGTSLPLQVALALLLGTALRNARTSKRHAMGEERTSSLETCRTTRGHQANQRNEELREAWHEIGAQLCRCLGVLLKTSKFHVAVSTTKCIMEVLKVPLGVVFEREPRSRVLLGQVPWKLEKALLELLSKCRACLESTATGRCTMHENQENTCPHDSNQRLGQSHTVPYARNSVMETTSASASLVKPLCLRKIVISEGTQLKEPLPLLESNRPLGRTVSLMLHDSNSLDNSNPVKLASELLRSGVEAFEFPDSSGPLDAPDAMHRDCRTDPIMNALLQPIDLGQSSDFTGTGELGGVFPQEDSDILTLSNSIDSLFEAFKHHGVGPVRLVAYRYLRKFQPNYFKNVRNQQDMSATAPPEIRTYGTLKDWMMNEHSDLRQMQQPHKNKNSQPSSSKSLDKNSDLNLHLNRSEKSFFIPISSCYDDNSPLGTTPVPTDDALGTCRAFDISSTEAETLREALQNIGTRHPSESLRDTGVGGSSLKRCPKNGSEDKGRNHIVSNEFELRELDHNESCRNDEGKYTIVSNESDDNSIIVVDDDGAPSAVFNSGDTEGPLFRVIDYTGNMTEELPKCDSMAADCHDSGGFSTHPVEKFHSISIPETSVKVDYLHDSKGKIGTYYKCQLRLRPRRYKAVVRGTRRSSRRKGDNCDSATRNVHETGNTDIANMDETIERSNNDHNSKSNDNNSNEIKINNTNDIKSMEHKLPSLVMVEHLRLLEDLWTFKVKMESVGQSHARLWDEYKELRKKAEAYCRCFADLEERIAEKEKEEEREEKELKGEEEGKTGVEDTRLNDLLSR